MEAAPSKTPRDIVAETRPARPVTSRNCLTVDVEEFFQCEVFASCVRRDAWNEMPRRTAPYLERLGALLQRHESRATFFVLGWTVEYLKPLLRDLAARGHEIACHGYGHEHIARLDPEKLREDLRRARGVIEDSLGVMPVGYRAPTFSVTRKTAWALDVIIEAGFEYDASIFPIHHDRYGVPDAPSGPFWAESFTGRRILEFPPMTLDLKFVRVPVGGGGYLRLLPGAVLRQCVAARQRRGEPVMLYVHPWELDPRQPRLPVRFLSQWRHRVNLARTESKLDALLGRFHFENTCDVLRAIKDEGALPVYRLLPG